MATVPSLSTSLWSSAKKITGTLLQSMTDAAMWLITSKPLFQSVQAVAQTGWTTATYTALTWTTEVADTDSQHSTSSNTSRVVIGNTLGWYRCRGSVCFAVNGAATVFRGAIALNGSVVEGSMTSIPVSSPTGGAHSIPVEFEVQATASGDYVELMGYVAAASGTLGTNVSSGAKSSFTVEWIRGS